MWPFFEDLGRSFGSLRDLSETFRVPQGGFGRPLVSLLEVLCYKTIVETKSTWVWKSIFRRFLVDLGRGVGEAGSKNMKKHLKAKNNTNTATPLPLPGGRPLGVRTLQVGVLATFY